VSKNIRPLFLPLGCLTSLLSLSTSLLFLPLCGERRSYILHYQVKDRLAMPDCITNGWLLDGFPRTQAQASALAESGVVADCFIFLNVPDSILVERVVGRRTDPVTGKIYHMTFSPPSDAEVLGRLEQRSDDTEEKVKVRLEQFHANVEAVKGSYVDIAVEVDGAQRPEDVSAVIMSSIDAVLA
jgi:adenylate kinase